MYEILMVQNLLSALHVMDVAIVRIRRFKNIQRKDSDWKCSFSAFTEQRKHFGYSAFSALLFSALK